MLFNKNITKIIASCFAIVSLLSFVGCDSNEGNSLSNTQTVDSAKPPVTLLTGSPPNEVEWQITDVKRTTSYTSRETYKQVLGDSVVLIGRTSTKDIFRTFFQDDRSSFMLVDKQGQVYKLQVETAWIEDIITNFMIPFSLEEGEKRNADINNWADLLIKDPNPASAALPGHQVSLGVFDNSAS